MKKIIYILFFIHFTQVMAVAQPFGWYGQNSGTTNNLNTVIKDYSNVKWVVGNNGTILYSTNDGINWINRASGTNSNLKYIYFPYFEYGFIAGSGGTVLRTTDSGASWLLANTGTVNDLYSTEQIANRIYVVGNAGTILRSTNGGANWSVMPSPTTSHLRSIAFGQSGTIVGTNGTILRSTDGGLSWYTYSSPTTADLNAVCYRSGIFWIAGNNGVILKSTNEGATWLTLTSGTVNNLYSVMAGYGVWVCGSGGIVLKSSNGGTNWVSKPTGTTNRLNGIYFLDINTGWAVGDNGTIIHTTSDTYGNIAKKMDANTISAWYRNNGSFNRDPVSGNSGFEWPKGTNMHARYASGIWIGAKVGIDTLIAMAEYDYEFLQGYTDNNGIPHGADDSHYSVYKLTHGVNDLNRQLWPNVLLGNSDQGAPVYFDTLSNTWKPLDYADQTMYYIYTDSYPESHGNRAGSTAPLKADIKQINWSFDEPGAMGNIIYSQFTIINRSNMAWNNAYISIWTDDDLGDAVDDLVACDTSLQMGYTYNGDNDDGVYGIAPPAVSFNLLKGPSIYTGNNNDTVFVCNGRAKKIKVGYRNLGMSVFNWYANAHPIYGDPRIYYETYRMMKGLRRDGNQIINPITNQPTTFFYSGDPVTNTGWVTGPMFPDDQRFILSVGPLNMSPGDTQFIVVAQVIARGNSNLNSITILRQYAQIAKENYNNCFANVPIAVENYNETAEEFSLEQNYPNPFNPKTVIKFSIPHLKTHRLISSKLTIYDILGREVEVLVNKELEPGRYKLEWDGSEFASGIYFYELRAGDFVDIKKMVLIK